MKKRYLIYWTTNNIAGNSLLTMNLNTIELKDIYDSIVDMAKIYYPNSSLKSEDIIIKQIIRLK